MKHALSMAFLLVFFGSPAWAQDSDKVDWKIAPYLWAVSMDGSLAVGEVEQEVDVSFSDLLSDLDFGASVYAEVGKGQHAIHLDYTWLRLRPDPTEFPSPPFPEGSTLTSRVTINIIEPAYHFRFDGPKGPALVLGARYIGLDMKMTPDLTGPGPIDPDPVKTGPNWWDWFVGFKTENAISANWDFGFYGTIGGGGSHLPWTLSGLFARRFSNENRLGLGVRVWGIDYSKNEGAMDEYTNFDVTFVGLVVGYEFN